MTTEWRGGCQRLVSHHDPGTHSMSGWTAQCKRKAATHRLITSGKGVYVCRQHAKEIDQRKESNFFTTPDTFFAWGARRNA